MSGGILARFRGNRNPDEEATPWRAYSAIVGGLLVHLTLGTLYSAGNMNPYVMSYLRAYSDITPDVRLKDGVWLSAVTIAVQGITAPVGGLIYQRFGIRIATLSGAWCMSLGVGLTYFTIQHSYWLVLITYSVMFGIGVGFGYTPPMACAMEWLPARRGFVTGIVLIGFGGGTFIMSQVQTAFMNPNNLPANGTSLGNATRGEKYFTQVEVLENVPYCFLLLGGVYAVVQAIGVALLFPAPAESKSKKSDSSEKKENIQETNVDHDGKGTSEALLDGQTGTDKEKRELALLDNQGNNKASPVTSRRNRPKPEREFRIMEMVRTRNFWCLWGTFLCMGQGLNLIVPLYKPFGMTFFDDDRFLAITVALSAVSNASGRPVGGFLGDKLSYKTSIIIVCTLNAGILLTMDLTRYGGQVMYLIWGCLYFFTFSGVFALLPACTSKQFGPRSVGVNYGVIFSAMVFASVIGGLLPSVLLDRIGYIGLFMVTACLALAAVVINLFFDGGPDDPYLRLWRRICGTSSDKRSLDINAEPDV